MHMMCAKGEVEREKEVRDVENLMCRIAAYAGERIITIVTTTKCAHMHTYDSLISHSHRESRQESRAAVS
jgi:hypothetical protein